MHRDIEVPLSNVTNGSTALVRLPQSLDSLSNQILSLTNIATALQKEMSGLSRRSRDNAADLLSLKEATNARDEDIRKSLRDLAGNVREAATKSSTRDPPRRCPPDREQGHYVFSFLQSSPPILAAPDPIAQ